MRASIIGARLVSSTSPAIVASMLHRLACSLRSPGSCTRIEFRAAIPVDDTTACLHEHAVRAIVLLSFGSRTAQQTLFRRIVGQCKTLSFYLRDACLRAQFSFDQTRSFTKACDASNRAHDAHPLSWHSIVGWTLRQPPELASTHVTSKLYIPLHTWLAP